MAIDGLSNYKTIEQIIESTKTDKEARKTGSELGKNDFLNLLVTQLRYQNPLDPVDDKEFIAQMAQFSALEQMQNMNGVLTNSQSFGLIGKHVTAMTVDPKTLEMQITEGIVSTVKMSNGKTYLVIDGKEIESDRVVEVNDSSYARDTNLSNYSNLIGYWVQGAVYDARSGDLIYLSGDVKAIQRGINEDYAVMDNVSVNIAEISGSTSADPNFMEDYLKDNIGKQVKITIKDEDSGYKVPVTATLKSYKIENGKVTAVVDDLYVSVYSVANIKKSETGSAAQG